MQGGLIGMRNGEHRRGLHLAAEKYYVLGRARLRGFDLDEETDLRETLPLGAQEVHAAIRASDWNPRANNAQRNFNSFVEKVWQPAVAENVEASSELVQGPGHFCFDVKVSKLMPRKTHDDDDINGSITRTRAIEILRILRTKLSQLPQAFMRILFRGPKVNDRRVGVVRGQFPDNEHDEPFSQNENDDFLYSSKYDKDEGPQYETFEKDWGLLIAVIKPRKNIDAVRDDLENL